MKIASNSAHMDSPSRPTRKSSRHPENIQADHDSKEVVIGTHSRSGPLLVRWAKRPRRDKVQCGICLESKDPSAIFDRNGGCSHRFCHDCIAQHVVFKVQEKLVPISCPHPNCSQSLMPEQCENVVPVETLDKWHLVLMEADIPDSQKYYCPFRDCSALLLNDDAPEIVIEQSECPVCRRLFCAQCKVPWHVGFDCNQFQSLPPSERENDDLKVLTLAKEKQWKRCPKCKILVEKVDGCPHMQCRCHFQFCYKCGSEWKINKRVPCKCPGWEQAYRQN